MKAAPLLIGCLCAAASVATAHDSDFITITNDGSGYGTPPGGEAFYYGTGWTNVGTLMIMGYTATNDTVVTIPDTINGISVTALGTCAFGTGPDYPLQHPNLTTITVPASVNSIYDAFAGSSNLVAVYFLGNAPSLQYVKGICYAFWQTHAIACFLPGRAQFRAESGAIVRHSNLLPIDQWDQLPVIQWDARAANLWRTDSGISGIVSGNTNLQAICVYSCTNLANPDWTPITTNLSLANGPVGFWDNLGANPPPGPARFYSVGWPK